MDKRNVIIFVDYENWYRSSILLLGVKPDVMSWYMDIGKRYECKQLFFFANFSRYLDEIPQLRKITENIIDTNSNSNKNMTDFIMLDYIYQTSQEASPDTYILYSGDGHFETVVRYLILKKRKKVLVYAIRGTLSKQLKEIASESVELPLVCNMRDLCIRAIIKKIGYLEKKTSMYRRRFRSSVVEEISEQLDIQTKTIEEVLNDMLALNYLIYSEVIENDVIEKMLKLNKGKLKERGFWM
jgi:uncharacterized LabA/DUF88 family protein